MNTQIVKIYSTPTMCHFPLLLLWGDHTYFDGLGNETKMTELLRYGWLLLSFWIGGRQTRNYFRDHKKHLYLL